MPREREGTLVSQSVSEPSYSGITELVRRKKEEEVERGEEKPI